MLPSLGAASDKRRFIPCSHPLSTFSTQTFYPRRTSLTVDGLPCHGLLAPARQMQEGQGVLI